MINKKITQSMPSHLKLNDFIKDKANLLTYAMVIIFTMCLPYT